MLASEPESGLVGDYERGDVVGLPSGGPHQRVVCTSPTAPLQKIDTPTHNRIKADSRRKTLVPVSPSAEIRSVRKR